MDELFADFLRWKRTPGRRRGFPGENLKIWPCGVELQRAATFDLPAEAIPSANPSAVEPKAPEMLISIKMIKKGYMIYDILKYVCVCDICISQSLEVATMWTSLSHTRYAWGCLMNSPLGSSLLTTLWCDALRYRKKILHRKRSISASQVVRGSSRSRWRAPRVVKAKAACQRRMDGAATQGHPIILFLTWS